MCVGCPPTSRDVHWGQVKWFQTDLRLEWESVFVYQLCDELKTHPQCTHPVAQRQLG